MRSLLGFACATPPRAEFPEVGGSRTPLLAKVPVSVLRLALLFSLGHALRVPLSAALLLCDPRSAVAFCLVTRSAYHSCWLFLAPRSAATSLGYALRVAFVYLFFRHCALHCPFCVVTRSAYHSCRLFCNPRAAVAFAWARAPRSTVRTAPFRASIRAPRSLVASRSACAGHLLIL